MKWLRAILEGWATIFSFGQYRSKQADEILQRSDADALRSDWDAVGSDLRKAIDDFGEHRR